jgi:hypothetical protein
MWNWGFQAGGPVNSTGAWMLNHQTSKISCFGPKFLCGCLKLEGLKVELGFSSGRNPLIPPGEGCEISKHLKVV